MRTPEFDAIDDNARKKTIAKSPKALRWLVEMLQEPMSVRQLHLRTKHPKKQLRAALVHLKMLGLIEEIQLPGGGSVWKIAERR